MSNVSVSQAERLDHYVAGKFPQLTRAQAAKLVDAGLVTVNSEVETKNGYKLRPNDIIVVDYEDTLSSQIPIIDLRVLYEDADCVVIEKPLGLLSHSKGGFNTEATVATWLSSRVTPELSGNRAGVIHRLDRATSGVMICAKNPDASKWLQKQFAQRRVKKTYLAIVAGTLAEKHAIIDMPIERNPKKPQTFRVGSNGKSATTEYVVLEEANESSLIELKPTTGRTHQLRVHLNKIGHPIVGDTLYGGKEADRLYLHAFKLELTLPNRTRQTFAVPIPDSFSTLMKV
jgi:23S rRNA pseudouridine1911/1915/1917 synthase